MLLLLLLPTHFSRVRLSDPIDSSPSGSPVLGILQARTLGCFPMHESENEREVAQSCPTLSDPMDCSLPGSSIHGTLQARVLQWVASTFSKFSMRGILFVIAGENFGMANFAEKNFGILV